MDGQYFRQQQVTQNAGEPNQTFANKKEFVNQKENAVTKFPCVSLLLSVVFSCRTQAKVFILFTYWVCVYMYVCVCGCVYVWPPVAVLNMLTAALLLWF